MKSGMVDIVIGTHRLLSKDIVFKNLGLLIIDEEQRFGVKHKEQIKADEEKCGCADTHGNTNSANLAYESGRSARHQSAGRSRQSTGCRSRRILWSTIWSL